MGECGSEARDWDAGLSTSRGRGWRDGGLQAGHGQPTGLLLSGDEVANPVGKPSTERRGLRACAPQLRGVIPKMSDSGCSAGLVSCCRHTSYLLQNPGQIKETNVERGVRASDSFVGGDAQYNSTPRRVAAPQRRHLVGGRSRLRNGHGSPRHRTAQCDVHCSIALRAPRLITTRTASQGYSLCPHAPLAPPLALRLGEELHMRGYPNRTPEMSFRWTKL
jgi:hypothetical protein